MPNTLNLISEDTFKEKMDVQNTLLAVMASNRDGLKITSWKDIQRIVRLGLADKIFAVGDKLICEREKAITADKGNSTGITAVSVKDTEFNAKLGSVHAGVYEFTYDGNVWHRGDETVLLGDYGITVTGTAVSGDTVVITETTEVIEWDIIGIDHDTPSDSQFTHSITLQMHDLFATAISFDAAEALYYCEKELAAGTYNFTLLPGYDTAYGGGKTLQFTTAKTIPAGGQIMFPWAYNTQSTDTKISTFASSTSAEALESDITVTEGTGGISLGTADGTANNMNHSHRIRYGSNKYSESAIRQWINSDGAAGNWWTPTNKFDRPSPQHTSAAGFLNGMGIDFLSVIGNVNKRTALNTVTDGGGCEDTKEKFFLLSRSEIFAGEENNIAEGKVYPYYQNYSDLSAAGIGNDKNRIKYRNDVACCWWLRSCTSDGSNSARCVVASGSLNNRYADNTYGVASVCCII